MRSFLAAYDAAGMLDPIPEVESITKKVMDQFMGRVEAELRLGLRHGYDVAVSEFEWDGLTQSLNAKILPLAAGVSPPPGRWTVYHCSRGKLS